MYIPLILPSKMLQGLQMKKIDSHLKQLTKTYFKTVSKNSLKSEEKNSSSTEKYSGYIIFPLVYRCVKTLTPANVFIFVRLIDIM